VSGAPQARSCPGVDIAGLCAHGGPLSGISHRDPQTDLEQP
jgi:hypothetical protein